MTNDLSIASNVPIEQTYCRPRRQATAHVKR